MLFEWMGVFPALTTKFSDNDALDLPLLGKNLQAQLDNGVHGIILGGTLGEASVLSLHEKEILVKYALEKINSKVPVILNIAEGATKEAIIQARRAAEWGADGLMLLPPMRYITDHRETVTFFRSIAENTELPIMLYNNPVDYKTEITLDIFEELTNCPNIQAVKDSTRDVTNVTRMINRFGKRYRILCGVDTLAMEELCLGADGWVAGLVCAFPAETTTLYRLIKAGRFEEAAELYRWFMPLLELDIHPKLVQYIKMAETATGLGSEFVRPPRLPIVGKERERILKVIRVGIETRPEIHV
jgi:dihydrodipicolinate synthase/N-acetylneuraminate lyase